MSTLALQLMIITVISKFSGLIREVVFSAVYGTNMAKDIYVMGESITAIAFSFLFMSLQSSFIPIYNNVLHKGGRKKADLFTSNMTNFILVIATVVIAFCFIFMDPIVHLVAPGFEGETFRGAVMYTRIILFTIYFKALSACTIGYLNIYDNFSVPATSGILMNVGLIISAVIAAKTQSLLVLAAGYTITQGAKFIFFPGALRKAGYHYRPYMNAHDPFLREALKIAIPLMFSILVNDISVIIDKSLASMIADEGGIAAMDYASKLFDFACGIVIVSIVTATYPRMSRFGQRKEMKSLKRLTSSSIVSGLALVVPATVLLMQFAGPIVRLFYQRGRFTAQSTLITSGALFWYAPGLIAMMFSQMNERLFYSISDSKTPLLVGVAQVAVDVIFNFILSAFFGLNGLAASTALGNIVGAILITYLAHRKIGKLGYRSILISFGKLFLLSGLMSLTAAGLYRILAFLPQSLRLILTVVLALLLYLFLVALAKIPEIRRFINQLYHSHRKKHARN